MASIRRRTRPRQGEFEFRSWGGPRAKAGRKPNGARAGVSHLCRCKLAARYPVHVTTRVQKGLPGLRKRKTYAALRAAFAAGCDRFGFRLVHYSVQSNHLHLLVEAKDRRALSRGVQGLLIRVAKALNRLWNRRGSVFADRYHEHVLRTPREVRRALCYVLNNSHRHGRTTFYVVGSRRQVGPDPYASGPWFNGWKERFQVRGLEDRAPPVAEARTWLMDVGWRRHGLVQLAEIPGPLVTSFDRTLRTG